MNEQALRRAVSIAQMHLPEAEIAAAREALDRLDERARLEPDRTVAAMVGATGSGKSSLVNALTGSEIARVAAIRPTTSRALAAVSGGGGDSLLDWLQIADRVELAGEPGLILLDLPDVDSVVTRHKEITRRLAEAVDVLVWVLDPEKYADAVMHREFIEPFATHGEVAIAVVNQCDRLDDDDRVAVASDVSMLFAGYGLTGEVMMVSARTGEGIAELGARLRGIAEQRTARAARASADVARAARMLVERTSGGGVAAPIVPGPLVDAAAAAAGADLVERAVRGSVTRTGRASVGWPVTRWLSRFRPDPMKRLHLDRNVSAELVHTSLPGPSPIQESAVRAQAHRVVDGAAQGLPNAWRASVTSAMDARIEASLAGLDGAVAGADLTAGAPKWWTAVRWLQWLLLGATVAGAAWLAVLWLLDYLKLPEPELPMAGPIPWPTALLLGGVALGILVAFLSMFCVRWRARRLSRRAAASVREAVAANVTAAFLAPLETELAQWREFTKALLEAAG